MSMVVMVILVVVAVMMVMMKVTMMIMMEMKSLYEQGQRKEEIIWLRRGQAVHGKDVKLLHNHCCIVLTNVGQHETSIYSKSLIVNSLFCTYIIWNPNIHLIIIFRNCVKKSGPHLSKNKFPICQGENNQTVVWPLYGQNQPNGLRLFAWPRLNCLAGWKPHHTITCHASPYLTILCYTNYQPGHTAALYYTIPCHASIYHTISGQWPYCANTAPHRLYHTIPYLARLYHTKVWHQSKNDTMNSEGRLSGNNWTDKGQELPSIHKENYEARWNVTLSLWAHKSGWMRRPTERLLQMRLM